VRAKVAHVFCVIKYQFGYRKVRYKGLVKNTAPMFALTALAKTTSPVELNHARQPLNADKPVVQTILRFIVVPKISTKDWREEDSASQYLWTRFFQTLSPIPTERSEAPASGRVFQLA